MHREFVLAYARVLLLVLAVLATPLWRRQALLHKAGGLVMV